MVLGTMFEFASKEIKVYSGNLCDEVTNNDIFKKGLEKFLKGGGIIKILVQKSKMQTLKQEPAIFNLLRYYATINPKQVSIKQHDLRIKYGLSDKEAHFTTADGKMYRIEDDIDKYTATGNFNDTITASVLNNLFDNVEKEAVDYSLSKRA